MGKGDTETICDQIVFRPYVCYFGPIICHQKSRGFLSPIKDSSYKIKGQV